MLELKQSIKADFALRPESPYSPFLSSAEKSLSDRVHRRGVENAPHSPAASMPEVVQDRKEFAAGPCLLCTQKLALTFVEGALGI